MKKMLMFIILIFMSGCSVTTNEPTITQYTVEFDIAFSGIHYTGYSIAIEKENYSYVYYADRYLSDGEIKNEKIDVFIDEEIYTYILEDSKWIIFTPVESDLPELIAASTNPFNYLEINLDWYTYSEESERYELQEEFKDEVYEILTGRDDYSPPEEPYISLYSNYITLDENGDIHTSWYASFPSVTVEFVENRDEYTNLPNDILKDLDLK